MRARPGEHIAYWKTRKGFVKLVTHSREPGVLSYTPWTKDSSFSFERTLASRERAKQHEREPPSAHREWGLRGGAFASSLRKGRTGFRERERESACARQTSLVTSLVVTRNREVEREDASFRAQPCARRVGHRPSSTVRSPLSLSLSLARARACARGGLGGRASRRRGGEGGRDSCIRSLATPGRGCDVKSRRHPSDSGVQLRRERDVPAAPDLDQPPTVALRQVPRGDPARAS